VPPTDPWQVAAKPTFAPKPPAAGRPADLNPPPLPLPFAPKSVTPSPGAKGGFWPETAKAAAAPAKPSLATQRHAQNDAFLQGVQARKAQLQAHPVHGTVGGAAHVVQQAIQNTTGVNLHGFEHPIAALQGKGEFAPPTRMFEGRKASFYGQPLPWFGGPKGVLAEEAGTAKAVSGTAKAASYVPRTVSHNDLVQQIPKARSRITNIGERLVDKASVQLQKSPHVQNIPGARLLTSGERVAKAAGRVQRQEIARTPYEIAQAAKTIHSVKEGSPESVAHFWYSQLPESHQNAADTLPEVMSWACCN